MSRSKSKKRSAHLPKSPHPVATPRVLRLAPVVTHPLKLIEDRRTYHPQGPARPARSLKKAQHTLKARPTHTVIRGPQGKPMKSAAHKFNPAKPFKSVPHMVGFVNPKSVLICIRRKIRKQIMFAKNLSRKGSGASRRRRNYYSEVKC